MAKSETEIQQSDVERQHHDEVHTVFHWAYLFGVLLIGFALMVGLIALLGSGS